MPCDGEVQWEKDKALTHADSSGPSSTVSSAGPSSPTSMENYARFGFTEKPSISPQISEERLNCQPPEQSEMEPSGEALELDLGGSGPLVENPLGEMPEQGLMRMPGLLEVPEPSKEEPSEEVPEQGTMRVLELGKTRQSGETSEKDGSVVLEQGGEKPAGGTWELGETGKLEPDEIGLSGKMSDSDEEGPAGKMLEPDVIRPVAPGETSVLDEEEPVMQTLEPSEEGQPVEILEKEEEELSTNNALSDQQPSSHPYQDQQLSSEKSVEDEQPSSQQELQN